MAPAEKYAQAMVQNSSVQGDFASRLVKANPERYPQQQQQQVERLPSKVFNNSFPSTLISSQATALYVLPDCKLMMASANFFTGLLLPVSGFRTIDSDILVTKI